MNQEGVSVRQPAPRAAGINKKVLAVLLGIVGLALGVSFYLGFGQTMPRDRDIALPSEEARPVTAKPEGLTALQNEDYVRVTSPPKPPEPVPVVPSPNPPPAGPPDLVLRPAAVQQPPATPEKSPREQRAAEAAKSGLFFAHKGAKTVAATQPQGTGQVQTASLPTGQPPPLPEDAIQNMQSRKEGFRDIPGTNPYLLEPYLQPRSPYEIKAGSIIPAALKTAINSDLPGDVTAQVTENVFDSATGRYLLIPQGTTLYGRYDSVIAYGQSRLLIIWQRLIMPDGRSIKVDNLVGTDALGRSGIEDDVNHHWGRLLAGVMLSTAISVGSEAATSRDNSSVLDTRSIGQSAADATAQEAVRIGSKITERNLNVQPTIEIRPGAVVKALVNKDMILAPY